MTQEMMQGNPFDEGMEAVEGADDEVLIQGLGEIGAAAIRSALRGQRGGGRPALKRDGKVDEEAILNSIYQTGWFKHFARNPTAVICTQGGQIPLLTLNAIAAKHLADGLGALTQAAFRTNLVLNTENTRLEYDVVFGGLSLNIEHEDAAITDALMAELMHTARLTLYKGTGGKVGQDILLNELPNTMVARWGLSDRDAGVRGDPRLVYRFPNGTRMKLTSRSNPVFIIEGISATLRDILNANYTGTTKWLSIRLGLHDAELVTGK